MRTPFYILMFSVVSGCGTYLPSLTGNEQDRLFVEDVHRNIQCEIIEAIYEANAQAAEISALQEKTVDFFKKWGVKYTLTLNVVEDSSFNPSINVLSPTTPAAMLGAGDSVFTLNGGLALSAKATRTETDQVFNSISDLSDQNLCVADAQNSTSVFENKLGVQPWLTTRLGLVQSGLITSITNKESFTYQVKFEIGKRSGTTPKWAFVKRGLKDAGTVLGAGRATSHSVLITFGPTVDGRQELATGADALHNARLISEAIN